MLRRAHDSHPRRSRTHTATITITLALLAAFAVSPRLPVTAHDEQAWPMIGHDPADSRNQPSEHRIRPDNVHRLAVKWTATTAGDVSATPAVVDGAVYFGDFGGMLWKLDAETGAVIWSHQVSDYTGIPGDIARTSPSLAGSTLVVGDLRHPDMIGINAKTGSLRWLTQVHPDPKGIMTGSPVLVGNTIITGVSASGASGPGATFRGAIVALDAQSGKILWRTYSLPDNGGVAGGYAGATMFSPPAVDERAGLVYGTFGQPYTEPAGVTACHAAAPNGFAESCEQPGSFLKSIVAFDLKTGGPRWSYRVQGHDPWLRACGGQPPAVTWCAPESDAEKWDIGGSGANVMRLKMNRHGSGEDGHGGGNDQGDDDGNDDGRVRDVVGVGGKSGVYIALDAKTGKFIWNTLVGPGGDQGGFEWGTAFDGRRIYVSLTNHHHIPYRLTQNGMLTNETATGGSWAALDPTTGTILWQTADPQVETLPGLGVVGVWDLAPVTVANGVVYVSSMAKLANQNQMFALDASTGAILWEFGAGSSVNSGPAVANGSVYWGTGYARSGIEGSGNTRLFAFSIDGR
ncbi:MAG TPA: PQQ-binding-like beta-propeller repeat protein [Vicinamibacterales bacterium]|nr:PQQ-binding-like beta-propeller repeat protein [Vicinamibacterales bacterium]